jgi:hypothetical protein
MQNSRLQIQEALSQSPSIFDFKAYDWSAWSLVAVNVLVIILAYVQKAQLPVVMLLYWFQSVIIGIFNAARIATFSGFQNVDNKIKDQKTARLAALFLAGFFMVHYGGFHWGYWSFIRGWTRTVDMNLVLVPSAIFFLHHLFSFVYNFKKERQQQDPRDLVRLMFFPYLRIIPMHITIIAGMFIFVITSLLKWNYGETLVLVLFLAFKTGADVKMHLVEHWLHGRGNEKTAAPLAREKQENQAYL